MAELDLNAIEAREQAATKGPWHARDDRRELNRWVHDEGGTLDIAFGYVGNRTEDDAEFVAHARTDVPALLAEVKRLRAAVPSWSALHDLLAAKRDTTDVELTNAVMALLAGQQDGETP